MSSNKERLARRDKTQLKERMKSFLMFLPNLVRLLGRLIKDPRVPKTEKALFLAAIVYVISPIDFIPDVFPFIGQVDDVYLVSLTLLRLMNRTDAAVLRENWPGGGDIVALIDSIAGLAPKFLPKRVRRVLESRVQLADAGKIISSITDKRQPIIVEVDSDGKPLPEPAR